MAWTQSLRQSFGQEIVAIDGKTVRRSHDRGRGQSAIHMVSAWASENGLVLGQIKTAEKSNEITAIPALLRALELHGCIVTIDAMGTQKAIAKEIVEADAEYVLALKGKSDIGDQINKKIIAPLAKANNLSDFPDFNEASKLGSGKEMVDRLTNLIGIFENPALDFSKNRADGDDILGDAYEYLMRHFATESGKS